MIPKYSIDEKGRIYEDGKLILVSSAELGCGCCADSPDLDDVENSHRLIRALHRKKDPEGWKEMNTRNPIYFWLICIFLGALTGLSFALTMP